MVQDPAGGHQFQGRAARMIHAAKARARLPKNAHGISGRKRGGGEFVCQEFWQATAGFAIFLCVIPFGLTSSLEI